MVSNASEDFPDPDRPVNTTSRSRGTDSVKSFRLCSRAPLMVMRSIGTFFSGLRKVDDEGRRGGGHQAAALPHHPALGDAGAAAGVKHCSNRLQALAYSARAYEAALQVEA